MSLSCRPKGGERDMAVPRVGVEDGTEPCPEGLNGKSLAVAGRL